MPISPINSPPIPPMPSHVYNPPAPQFTPEDVSRVQQSLCSFAQDLHRNFSSDDENSSFCFSPSSLSPILGIILLGIDNKEHSEQLKLRLNLENMPNATVHWALNQICQSMITADDASCTINTANGLAVLDGVDEGFKEGIKSIYDSEVFHARADIFDQINSWVSAKTEKMIPELFDPATSLESLSCVFVNALYFKGEWTHPFDVNDTYEQAFTCADGSQAHREMMHKSEANLYFADEVDKFSMLEKEFCGRTIEGESISFIVFLPNQADGLHCLEQKLSKDFILKCRSKAESRKVDVTLPKMDIELSIEDLNNRLTALGFPMDAMLENINERAYIDKIVQRTKLVIDEGGGQGAARTGAIYRLKSYQMLAQFKACHPFAYYVMAGDNILFQGAIKDGSALKSKDESLDAADSDADWSDIDWDASE